MTPLHRSVPQRRRRNLTHPLLDVLVVVGMMAFSTGVTIAFMAAIHQPRSSRLQPALDQIQRFGERKCWSGEVVR